MAAPGVTLHRWPCSDLTWLLTVLPTWGIVLVRTPQDSRRCRWLTCSPKSSASCRSRASAPSTGTGTARGSSPASWSYPCSPPPLWNPEGSSPWSRSGPLGAWEEVVRVAVAGCGHPGTSVRKERRTASAPAAEPRKAFGSLSSLLMFSNTSCWGYRQFSRWIRASSYTQDTC